MAWLGPDYVVALVRDLALGLLRQDPGTRLLGVYCETMPELTTKVDSLGVVRAGDAGFVLRVYLQDGYGRPWRLHGAWTYTGRELGTPRAVVDHHWELYGAGGA